MAYYGSTASSSLANPPRLLVGRFQGVPGTTGLSTSNPGQGSQGGSVWYYASTNTSTELQSSTFFTDGWYLGMRAGDVLIAASFSSAGSTVNASFGIITHASTSGCGLSTGSVITSSFS